MSRIVKRIVLTAIVATIALLVVQAFRPKPILVELGRVARGPLQVTVDNDGETRSHDRFTLAAPVAGQLARITLHEGDAVRAGSAIASIRLLPLDARSESETRAQVEMAAALKREADAQLARSENEHEQAKRELARAEMLAQQGLIPGQTLEQARSKEVSAGKDVEAARQRAAAAEAELRRQQAGLLSVSAATGGKDQVTVVRAPMASRILQILEKSERVVTAGTPLVVLSNPSKLEVVIAVLSTDAVTIQPGARVSIENWGGAKPLRAVVRTVEPFGFTKVSALGIEEKRVNVIADFADSPAGLGDGYHVDARIVVWESGDVLKVPASALFRIGADWHVFVERDGVARQSRVETGHRNALEVEAADGLQEGSQVILHPANTLKDGDRVRQ